MFENMTPRVEAKIKEVYKTLQGLPQADAEAKFLERASEMETYGVEPVFVQDRKGNNFYVGLSHEGVTAFRGNRKAHVFLWSVLIRQTAFYISFKMSKIHRISFDGKLFVIQVQWENCVLFRSLNRSTEAKKSKANARLFRKPRLYSFTGRCQKEMLQMTSSMPNIPQPSVSRSRSLLNIAISVSRSRQTKSHEELTDAFSKYLDEHTNNAKNGRSVSVDALSGGGHLVGADSESTEQLNQRDTSKSSHDPYAKLYQSSELISNSASPKVTTTGQNGELLPKVSAAGSPLLPKSLDDLSEVAKKEVDEVLTHAEIMRLVTHSQIDETKEVKKIKTECGSSYEEEEKPFIKTTPNYSRSNSSDNIKHSKKEDVSVASTKPPLPSPLSSPRKLDWQEDDKTSIQNKNSSSSESYLTQFNQFENRKVLTDGTETVSSNASPVSYSSASLLSPKIKKNVTYRSTTIDPPSDFAEKYASQSPKDIYFPYLSKVKNIDYDFGTHEKLYHPLRLDKPSRDPFSLPCKTEQLSVAIEPINDSIEYSSTPQEPSIGIHEGVIKTPTQLDRSPLLLRHGYTPYRGLEVNSRYGASHRNKEEYQSNIVGPHPAIVKAGCAPPIAEPIIVAEYFVPLCDDEEEDDTEESKAESVKNAAVSRVVGKSNHTKGTAPTPFDWSAASARMEKNLNAKSAQETQRLSPMATVVLSQEIVSPRFAFLIQNIEDWIQRRRSPLEVFHSSNVSSTAASGAVPGGPDSSNQPIKAAAGALTANINLSPINEHALRRPTLTLPVPRRSQAISSVPDLITEEPTMQRTLIQISQTRGSGDDERRREENKKFPDVSPKGSLTADRSSTSGGSILSPTLVQFLWFLGVFFFVHHILKVIRVGPIMGFFGATGPDAIGYWSVIEAVVDFFFFRIF
ncbi:unnamed protein product [Rodentolepis nana]|uniref:FERM domain-containing protein n=1 Tax=Rodentolepis nana TaxID=102285 RepID=A0A158QJE4_RODNA|nr:unnamed protein product [Rodentolepis nana]